MIQCEVCGKKLVRLRLHLRKAHKMSVSSYTKLYPNAPTVDPLFADKMRQATLNNGTSNNVTPVLTGEVLKKGESRNIKEEKE